MAAEAEEALVDADAFEAQDLGEELAEDFLVGCAGRPYALRVGGGGGQGPAVDLAVGVERERVQHHERGRHHVRGQFLGGPLGEVVGVGCAGLSRDDVGDQAFVARPVLADDDDAPADAREAAQYGLDLAEFDAEAADLHLSVGPAHELDHAIGQQTYQVARAVHALAGAVRAGDEPFRRKRGPGRVAAGHAGAREVQLTRRTFGHLAQGIVQDVGGHAVHGASDGHGRADAVGRAQREEGGEGGGLGGAVDMDELGVRAAVEDALDRLGRACLTAAPHLADQVEDLGVLLGDQVEQGGGQEQAGDAVLFGEVAQGARIELAGRGEHGLVAGQERHPHFVGGRVEGVRGVHEDAALCLAVPAVVGGEGEDVPVGHGDALGGTRGAGGEHDVGEPEGVDDRAGVHVGAVGEGGVVVHGERGHEVVEEVARVGGAVGEQDRGAGLVDDRAHAGGRVGGVQRHIGGARLEDGEQGHHQVGGAFHQHGHGGLGAVSDAEPGQPVRQPVGRAVEFAVGEECAVAAQGHGVGSPSDLCGERGHDVAEAVRAGTAVVVAHRAAALPGLGSGRRDAVVGHVRVTMGRHSFPLHLVWG